MLSLAAMGIGLLYGLAGEASAAVYWANGNAISRMNLDGTNPSPELIASQSQLLGTPCGLAVDGSHLYWADEFGDRIGRAGLDGSNREDDFVDGADKPCGVAVDAGHVYWANEGGNSIGRANLDGTGVEQEFVPGATHACGVAVNEDFIYWAGGISTLSGFHGIVGRALRLSGSKGPNVAEVDGDYDLCGVVADESHVYWGGYGDAIGRVGVDGSDPEPRFITGLRSPCSVAIGDGKLYFGEIGEWRNGNGYISRANLDGAGVEREIVGAKSPCGIAVDSLAFGPAYIAPPPLPSWTPCKIDRARVNTWNGSALIRLTGPVKGDFGVVNRALRWRVLSKRPPLASHQAAWPWWIKIRPATMGRAARHLHRRLEAKGRVPIRLRIECSEEGSVDNASVKRLVLRLAD
jgi:hypothetical protein